MSKINIYETGWLNMVFEGRNKAYGAYQLRAENPKTTIKALFSALLLLGSAAAIPVVIGYFQPKEAAVVIPDTPGDIIHVIDYVPPIKESKPEEPTAPEQPVTQNTIKHINMVVAPKPNATEEPPTNAQLQNANIGQATVNGPATTTPAVVTTTATTPGTGSSPGGIETTATLEMQPQYPGGIAAFLSTVGKSFKAPDVDEGVKTLKVLVYFVIEKDGTLSNIRVTRDPGYNLGKEAIRVLNNMKTKWSPGYKNGQAVRTAYNLPITINVN